MKADEHWDLESQPVGTAVEANQDTPQGRLTSYHFQRYLFEYFHCLAEGYTGWGIDFIEWLEMSKGWQKVQGHMYRYKRVRSFDEELEDE